MKQLLQYLRDGKTVVAEVPIPQVKPGTALVRTCFSLVSAGTERMLVEFAEKSLLDKARSRPDLLRQLIDKARREGIISTLESALNRLEQPMALGYSSAGIIAAPGEGMTDFKPGDRVACAGGNHAVHAEYAVIPRNLLTRLPDNVDFESGAFTTIGAIALHGFRLAQPQVGESIAVIGLGLLGQVAAMIARAAGCRVFGVDLDQNRIELAKSIGITAVNRSDAEKMGEAFTHNHGFDSVLICADTTGSDPIQLAATLAMFRGKIISIGAVGMTLQRKIFYEKELTFLVSRSYGPGRYDEEYEEKGHDYPIQYVRWTEGRNFTAFLELVSSGKIDIHPLISHTFPIQQADEAYSLISGKRKEKYLGVLISYPPPPEDKSTLSPKEFSIITETTPIHQKTVGQVRLGILGAGLYAQSVFLPNLKKTPLVERIAIASSHGLSASHAAQKYNFSQATSQETDILNNPKINTVVILSRHQDHSGQVLTAMRNGKHVFCEKPLAISLDQLSEISELLKQPDHPILTVGFNRRFAPHARLLKQFFTPRSEPLVIHYRINAGYLPLNHWLHDPDQGGGRIIGEVCHFIDFLTYLTDSQPVRVSAVSMPNINRYHLDNVSLTFTYEDGSIGSILYLANGNKRFPKERIEVFSAGRIGILDDFRRLELISERKRRVVQDHFHQDKGHIHIWKAFLDAVVTGSPPPIQYTDLLTSTYATLIANKAASSHTTLPIDLL